MTSHRVDPGAPTQLAAVDGCAVVAERAERKADRALMLLASPLEGLVPRVEQIERVMQSLDRKAPSPVAVWIAVVCLLLLTVFAAGNLLLSIAR